MKKKLLLIIPIIVAFIFCINVKAKTYTPDRVTERSYIIGTHLFTRRGSTVYDGTLTTQWIMLASKTIETSNLDDRIIYYKDSEGAWTNAITDEEITPPREFEIEFSNGIPEYEIETPVLILSGHPAPFVKLIGIDEATYCTVTNGERTCTIDGLEFYEKNNDTGAFTEVDLPLEVEGDLIGLRLFKQIGETKTYKIRAYKEFDGTKVYSEYSNELEVSLPVPLPDISVYGVSCVADKCFAEIGSGLKEELVFAGTLDEPDLLYYDSVRVFETINNQEVEVEVDEAPIPVGGARTIEDVTRGTVKHIYARPVIVVIEDQQEKKILGPATAPIEVVFDQKISFDDARAIDTSEFAQGDNEGILLNAGKYEVTKENNIITVTDKGMIPYVGGNLPTREKWVGILVDLGTEVVGEDYTINPEDYEQAGRWGAPTNTTFVMWLAKGANRTVSFVNKYDDEDTIELSIRFENDMEGLTLSNVSRIDPNGFAEGDNIGIQLNANTYTLTKLDGNTVTITDKGIIPYKGGNQPTVDKKWVGIVVDFGVRVVGTGYNIADEDYEQAERWGGQSDTAFVLWTTTDDYPGGRTIRFTDPVTEKTIDLNINFVTEN